jgi:apolipoprotein N-acyltransferase
MFYGYFLDMIIAIGYVFVRFSMHRNYLIASSFLLINKRSHHTKYYVKVALVPFTYSRFQKLSPRNSSFFFKKKPLLLKKRDKNLTT